LSESWIGFALAIQYGILGILAPLYGVWADALEAKRPHYGRSKVLIVGVLFGGLAFGLHSLDRWISIQDPRFFHVGVQILYAICFASLFPVVDGMAVDYCQKYYGDSTDYGKERLYGAVSWGLTNLIMGPLIDRFGMMVYYPCMVASTLVTILTTWTWSRAQEQFQARTSAPIAPFPEQGHPEQSHHRPANTPSHHRPSTWSLVVALCGTLYGATFLLCYFLLNSGFSVVENLVFLFLEFLGASNTLCAWTVLFTVLFEVPIFFTAPTLLRKYGVGGLLLLACLAYWIRVVGYTLLPSGHAAWVLFLEPLHGITYAGAQSAAVEFVQQRMPPGSEAGGQGLVNFVRGVASVIGLWAGGFLQQTWGPRFMYRVFVVAVSIGMGVFGIARWNEGDEKRDYDRVPEAVDLTV